MWRNLDSKVILSSDAVEQFMGNPVQEHIPSPETSSTSITGAVVHQAFPAEFSGTLVGLEYYAGYTGDLTVHVSGGVKYFLRERDIFFWKWFAFCIPLYIYCSANTFLKFTLRMKTIQY